MTLRPVPAWLEELELRFGAMLALPLAREGGSLEATPERYDPVLEREVRAGPRSPASARLAVYQRQYWFRLLTVMHAAYPLTTRLLGHWHFNELATRFLGAHPAQGHDLDAVPDGFDSFLAAATPGPVVVMTRPAVELDRDVLLDAARLDAAYRRVLRAPEVQHYRPNAADAERLLAGRLELSPAVALLTDTFGSWELRGRILDEPGEVPVRAPPRLAAARHGALVRSGLTLRLVPLEADEHELLCLLGEHSVGHALAALESSRSASERHDLPERARRWLARSVDLGLWSGFRA